MSASSLEFGPTLPQLAVLGVGGADALEFMQGQLSQDLRELADGSTRLAALHTPQGRVVATMWLRQAADGRILTLLPASLAETVTARLRRYVLRSRVSIEPLADWTLRESLHPTAAHAPSGCVFELPDGRRLQAAPGPAAAADPAGAERAYADWVRRDLAAGLPLLGPASSEQFVAQMLNLDLLGAISFTKGCYTGQEIVARTQHLGRIKRRLQRYRIAAPLVPEPLQALNRDGVKVGEVLYGAADANGSGAEFLAIVALEVRDLPLRTESGHTASPLPLPYRVP